MGPTITKNDLVPQRAHLRVNNGGNGAVEGREIHAWVIMGLTREGADKLRKPIMKQRRCPKFRKEKKNEKKKAE